MDEDAVLQIVENLRNARDRKPPSDTARDLIRLGVAKALVDAALERLQTKAAEIEHWRNPNTISDRRAGSWYAGPSDNDPHWPRVRSHLRAKWNDDKALDSLDRASSKVVSCLHDPHGPTFSTRGLVAGDVQSGKTSNFTATIAKCADEGFRLFIVLSGTKSKLRRQTQKRLEDDLTTLNPAAWLMLTSLDLDFQKSAQPIAHLVSDHNSQHIILVAKKNARVLERIVAWLDAGTATGVLAHCPTVVIDDEADEASINVAEAREARKAVNAAIVSILTKLPRVCFVGYTATPYANFFIDPAAPEDLYPRDFIINLSSGGQYFGYEAIFGRNATRYEDESDDIDGLDMIRHVDDSEAASLRPNSREIAGFTLVLSTAPALRRAVLWFFLATAARHARGQTSSHSSMLIHTSQRTAVHQRCRAPIEEFRIQLKAAVERGDASLVAELRALWEEECLRVPETGFDGLQPVSFDDVLRHLPNVANATAVVAENSISPLQERLVYGDRPGLFIAIGGDVLSRGLTLEGLVSSYFTRTASTYDTLMQMGRWFGYRHGYEDLPRIWMTDELRNSFYDLAGIDREMRQMIDTRYAGSVTPREYAPLIRRHPRMMITSRLKMRNAMQAEVSFSNEHVQTIHLYRKEGDSRVLSHNLDLASRLIQGAIDAGRTFDHPPRVTRTGATRHVLRGVPERLVLDLLGGFAFHPQQVDIGSRALRDYIEAEHRAGSIRSWNLAVVGGPADGGTEKVVLAPELEVTTVRRSRLKNTGEDANLKGLMSLPDILVDCDDSADGTNTWDELKEIRNSSQPRTGLILFYPIDRTSDPVAPARRGRQIRQPLAADNVVLGLGVVLPPSSRQGGSQSYMTLDLSSQVLELPDEIVEPEEEA